MDSGIGDDAAALTRRFVDRVSPELKCSERLSGTPLKALIPAQIDGSLDDATFATLIEEGRRGEWLEYAMPI